MTWDPEEAGLPVQFTEWRRGQEEAIQKILFSKRRFIALTSPTGAGKSATYAAVSGIDSNARVAWLTATKNLQDQLYLDFSSMGVSDGRGRSNFTCDIDVRKTAAEAVCVMGEYCPHSKADIGGCGYFDQLHQAKRARIVSTNYSMWMEHDLGHFDILVLDEAHKAPDQISNYASFSIKDRDLDNLRLSKPPSRGDWVPWAHQCLEAIEARRLAKEGDDRSRLLSNRIKAGFARLIKLSTHSWVRSRDWGGVTRFDLLRPDMLAEELLFKDAAKVILCSASLRQKTLKLLGIGNGVTTYVEQASTFPIKRRPIYYWPVVRLNARAGSDVIKKWVGAIDSIIGPRVDRKGIIHTVSYDRAIEIYQRSEYRELMMVHERKMNAADVLRDFRNSPQGTILLSPSMVEGVNLAYQDCEYAIVAKVPYPGMGDPLIQARSSVDQSYPAYLAYQSLVQSVGRHMRAHDDLGETFIVDAAYSMLMGRFYDFAPKWFHQAVIKVDKAGTPPMPPPCLNEEDPLRFPHTVWVGKL